MSVLYPWRFCYAAGRHPKAGPPERPSLASFGLPGVDFLYAETAMGCLHGNAMYRGLLDNYPCCYWERHAYYYDLSKCLDSARSATLKEFVALGFRFTRGDGHVVKTFDDFEPSWSWHGGLDQSRVDAEVLDYYTSWEQLLRARYQALEAGRTLASMAVMNGTRYSNFN